MKLSTYIQAAPAYVDNPHSQLPPYHFVPPSDELALPVQNPGSSPNRWDSLRGAFRWRTRSKSTAIVILTEPLRR